MRTTTTIILAGTLIGAAVAGGIGTASAQYYPPPPGYGDGWRSWNGCPPGYTVQGGACAPYRGPVGGGWRTFNGCPPGYTVQGGSCASEPAGPASIGKLLGGKRPARLFGRPYVAPEFCRENFVLRI